MVVNCLLLENANSSVLKPLEEFRKKYIGGVKSEKKKFEKQTAKFCQNQERYLNKTTKNPNTLQEINQHGTEKGPDQGVEAFRQMLSQHMVSMRGIEGPRGLTGLPGPQGLTGPDGQKGEPGDIGETGPRGTAGIPGPLGHQGRRGQPGRDGERGLTGPSGAKGEQGLIGLPGLPGDKGDRGLPGATGETGFPGHDGMPGEDGPSGSPGLPGEIVRLFIIIEQSKY
ncbi:hypothetical protein HUJ05_000018 [Dendroctonus ponderosae]|nr:hypothetical protein HUJ05_000018 [Dendroctonus ponderosae]